MDFLNTLLFGYYPYVAITVFLVGSLARFERDQYGWRTGSSQLLRADELRKGSNLFHIGVKQNRKKICNHNRRQKNVGLGNFTSKF